MPLASRTSTTSSKSSSLSMSSKVTLAVRSSVGRKKVEVTPTTSGRALKAEIKKALGTDEDFVVKRDNNGRPGNWVLFKKMYHTKIL